MEGETVAASGPMDTNALVQALERALGSDPVLAGEAVERYCRDWHGDVTTGAVAVLRPRTTAEVSAAVRAASALGLSIVPQGGNTGLVLGATPDQPARQVVLSLERLTRVRSIDPDDFSAVVEAGVILSDFKDKVEAADMFFPLTLGAQGTCRIGGNVSTNAGGNNVLRYGMTRDLVLGLEVVLPDGSVFNGLSTLRKDNRGIDLKQLFIGAEGTLGIVTAVSVKLMPKPTQVATALLGLRSLDDVITLYRRARRDCCDLMSAFEFMPPLAFTLAREAIPDLIMPMNGEHPAYVLMDIAGSGLVDVEDLMGRFLEGVMEDGLVIDGVVASSGAQARNLWLFREGMIEGQAKRGPHLRTDVSVPLSQLANFVRDAESALLAALPGCVPVSYGHVGDGNIHSNVQPPADLGPSEIEEAIHKAKIVIDDVVENYGGSISAEHGIGRLKKPEFIKTLPETQKRLLQAIKMAIDPTLIMNPGCQLNSDGLAVKGA